MGCCGGGMAGGRRMPAQRPAADSDDLRTVLTERLARGEISKQQYEEILAIVQRDSDAPQVVKPRQMAGG